VLKKTWWAEEESVAERKFSIVGGSSEKVFRLATGIPLG
jgi:hypothetical protein